VLVWAGYTANFIFGLVPYIIAPVVFSILIYFLSYFGLRRSDIFLQRERYQNSTYSDGQIDKCFEDLGGVLTKGKAYTDPDLTLPKMARLLNVSPNLLSETINRRTQQSFPEYINSLRVKEAQLLLNDPKYLNEKISTIAYETGFSSISVFNAAFKKFTKTTPSAFRKPTS